MAKMEGREKDLGLLMMNSIPPTRMKMRVLETKMARRKLHLMLLKLSFAREVKMRTGSENLPTNVFRPADYSNTSLQIPLVISICV